MNARLLGVKDPKQRLEGRRVERVEFTGGDDERRITVTVVPSYAAGCDTPSVSHPADPHDPDVAHVVGDVSGPRRAVDVSLEVATARIRAWDGEVVALTH